MITMSSLFIIQLQKNTRASYGMSKKKPFSKQTQSTCAITFNQKEAKTHLRREKPVSYGKAILIIMAMIRSSIILRRFFLSHK